MSNWIPNKTWEEEPTSRKSRKLSRIVKMQAGTAEIRDGVIVKPGLTVKLDGHAGIGKTSATQDEWRNTEVLGQAVHTECYSIASIMPSDMYLTIPTVIAAANKGASDGDIMADAKMAGELLDAAHQSVYALKTILSQRLLHDGPWQLTLDEANRVPRVMLASFMELTNDGALLGEVLPNLVAVTLLQNPAGAGYIGTTTGDLAYESRFPTFDVTEKDIAWREHLAQKFADVDLKSFFDFYKTLDANARRIYSPRVIDHTIMVTLKGLPPHVAMPIMPAGRTKVLNASGEDVTDTVLKSTAESLGQTYRSMETTTGLFDRCAEVSKAEGWNMRVVGPHGVGKTTVSRLKCKEMDVETKLISASAADPSTMVQLVPMHGKVQPILADKVSFDKPGILILDEFTLADKTVKPQLLEIAGPTRSIAGMPLNVVAIWALDNPARYGGIQYNNRTADEAMVSRFVINLEVTEDDFKWREALEDKFGEEAFKPFAEWRSQDLNHDEKPYVMPRTLSIMATLHAWNLDVESALPKLGADRIPIRLHGLKARLSNRKVLGLSAIIAEANSIIEILTDPNAADEEKVELENAAVTSFQNSEVKDLEPHADILVEFIKALPAHCRTDIISAAQAERPENAEKKLRFWGEVFGRTL